MVTLALRAEHADLVAILLQSRCLFPDTIVKRNRQVLDNDEDFSLHNGQSLSQSDLYRFARAHNMVACPQCMVGVVFTSQGE
jgi:hypothetical protein